MQKSKACVTISALATFLFMVLSIFTRDTFSQQIDSTNSNHHFGGAVTLTNNGISLLPIFSLGKPAVMFDMSVGNKKLSFEPQFRFSLEGKPWTFLFGWRYKLLNTGKFQVRVGGHPVIAFRRALIAINGDTSETLVAQRFLAGEFSPNYSITKNISMGIFYLHSHGFAESGTKNTHFVTINSNFSHIKLSEQVYMKFYPQFYYLWMDKRDGYYVTATLTLAKRNFPLSLQSILNETIKTNILARKDFIWNISLIYSFNKEYFKD